MEWKLEVVPIPVSDVDRAKNFYAGKAGFVEDHDVRVSDEMRVVQLTPPGSACSIVLGTGILDTPPGSSSAGWTSAPCRISAGSCTPPSATRTGTR